MWVIDADTLFDACAKRVFFARFGAWVGSSMVSTMLSE